MKLRDTITALHSRLGDFWWYSVMLFCAYRAADVLNAFVGLWLVPQYISPEELGAVLPLANFANMLALPMAAFANTFRNEVSRLSSRHALGELKTLLKSVFAASGIFLAAALALSHFILPLFLERIRIANGSLGFLILTSALLSSAAPIFTNALQSLKKFREQSMLNIIGAPVRILTMIAAMPFRALSGYFLGQSAPWAFSIVASVLFLKKELAVKARPYWTGNVVRKFARLFLLFLILGGASCFVTLAESTILRQRLPDLDSAGYYMVTRFSDISNFLYSAIVFALFPFSAELAAKGKDMRPLVFKAGAATFIFSALIAVPFAFCGKEILALLPNGGQYCAFWWAIPWMIALNAFSGFSGLYMTSQIAAGRFGFLKWMLPLDIAYPAALFAVTGHGYLAGCIPGGWTEWLKEHNIYSLHTMMIWMTAAIAAKSIISAIALALAKPACENEAR